MDWVGRYEERIEENIIRLDCVLSSRSLYVQYDPNDKVFSRYVRISI